VTPSQEQQIKDAHFELPENCRRRRASPEELAAFENEFGAIPADYRWYLVECGGGVIGSEWIDGIGELAATHRKVREAQRRGFYRIAQFFPLGWDGFGNAYGYDLQTGRIVMEDHNFGGVHEIATGLYELICKKGLVR
jgi:hypothetical protein